MSEHELNDDEYLHEIECVEESVMAEERESLRKQIDWLAKVIVRYADACPRDIFMRFIPTCVGNTRTAWRQTFPVTVHPHMRGEYG